MIVACIPAYNAEKSIASMVVRAKKHVHKVIVCDDGSKDMTAEIAEALGAIVVRHETNEGYGAALRTLLRAAVELNAEIMVTLDADGQHNPDEIPHLVEQIVNKHADVVIGSRFLGISYNLPRYRRFGIKMVTHLVNQGGSKVSDAQSGFRAYSMKSAQLLIPIENSMSASIEILYKASQCGLRITEVPISMRYSNLDASTQTPLLHGLDLIMGLVKHRIIKRPLSFLGLPAITFTVLGIFFMGWSITKYALEGQLITNMALIGLSGILLGITLGTAALILFVLITVAKEGIR